MWVLFLQSSPVEYARMAHVCPVLITPARYSIPSHITRRLLACASLPNAEVYESIAGSAISISSKFCACLMLVVVWGISTDCIAGLLPAEYLASTPLCIPSRTRTLTRTRIRTLTRISAAEPVLRRLRGSDVANKSK